ncbi:TPA: hypothetical protein P2N00_000454 [Aeromonas salmonicida]|uniref:Uncharacterized protein n=1 Tax=Aeromonas salmonicida subsp. salmonicida TaxID=29491 RepID=A0A0A7KTR4_AERSS|nr:hypothetical protein [Aeromonas salmonicida]AIZ49674.1 hypothetical protein [Aeromonas salmonicida subsp. salmonicida]OAH88231.1 hypothetical protein AXW79_01205 [Aeromonas salmonicida subsp. salmonicida]OKA78016.1 hypothetical protein BHR41_02250 [Aeromonas salmonicida subsp. salmonicida]SPT72516.1 Uncharacterised protein [Aeromonas salmonicida]SPT73666.1 Uncharacterised protein [Aeromonas salmonicida]
MWILFAIVMMVLALKAFSFSFMLALIPFAIGCWGFSQSTRASLDTFMAFMFALVLLGLGLNVIVANW